MSETAFQGALGKIELRSLLRFLLDNDVEGTLDLRNATGESGALDVASGRLVGVWSGTLAGEPALAAIIAARPTEFRFRAAPARAANLTGDLAELFARATASVAGAAAPLGVDAVAAVSSATAPAEATDAAASARTMAHVDVRQAELSGRGTFATRPKPPARPAAPTLGNVWRPGHLVALANALLAEYVIGQYGGLRWDPGIGSRVRRVNTYMGLPTPLPISDGRIDAPALVEAGHPLDAVVPYLRAVVREVYREADRTCGGSAARRGYRTAFQRLWGADEELWLEGVRLVEVDAELRGQLSIVRGLPPRTIVLVEREYSLGRGEANDITLRDPTVSRRHATITPRQGCYVLKDLGSTSGAIVNGKPIAGPRELAAGDVIELGQVILRFDASES